MKNSEKSDEGKRPFILECGNVADEEEEDESKNCREKKTAKIFRPDVKKSAFKRLT